MLEGDVRGGKSRTQKCRCYVLLAWCALTCTPTEAEYIRDDYHLRMTTTSTTTARKSVLNHLPFRKLSLLM
jgi:hypothetical protein